MKRGLAELVKTNSPNYTMSAMGLINNTATLQHESKITLTVHLMQDFDCREFHARTKYKLRHQTSTIHIQ